jgi:hypothetical protein
MSQVSAPPKWRAELSLIAIATGGVGRRLRATTPPAAALFSGMPPTFAHANAVLENAVGGTSDIIHVPARAASRARPKRATTAAHR